MTGSAADIRILGPGDQPALEAFLLPRLASSMFLLSNSRLAGLVDTGERYTGTYVAAFEDDHVVGVVAQVSNGMLIPQAPVAPAIIDRLWRAAVEASGRPVRGVIGDEDQATTILASLDFRPDALRLNHREKLYRLSLADLNVPAQLASGEVVARRATVDDLETLTDWGVDYDVESLGADPSPEQRTESRDATRHRIEEGSLWVLERKGACVAMTGFNAQLAEAVQVGGVYTPPDLRSRGYARCAVAGSLLAAREDAVREAILFTAEDNLPAQKAYEALGFRHIGYFRLTLL